VTPASAGDGDSTAGCTGDGTGADTGPRDDHGRDRNDSTDPGSSGASAGESPLAHLAQPDHWTFLLALVLVAGNVVINSRLVSLAATVLLSAALAYDAYEFYGERVAGG
jgi:hypothetical protein